MRKKKAKTIFEVLSLVLLIFIVVSAVSNLNENVMAGQGEMPVLKEPKVLQEEVLVCPKEGMGRPVPFVVDWDNDGKKDLLLGEIQSAGIRLFKNKGTDAKPYFPDSEYLQAEGTMLMVGFSCAHSVCPYVADWNNDGKKDLIVGTTPGYVGVYLNVGTNDSPMFGSSTEDPPAMFALSAEGKDIDVGEQAAPCVTDWNNDGKKDLLVGCEGGTISLFLNIGTDADPVLDSPSLLQAGGQVLKVEKGVREHIVGEDYLSNVRHVDWDRDGVKDLLVGSGSGKIFFYKNIGTNSKPVLASGEPLKADGKVIELFTGDSYIDVVDWNNDGGLDIVAGTTSAVYLIESIPDGGVEYIPPNENGDVIVKSSNCIPAFTPIDFGVETNEPSQCKIDSEDKSYDEMAYYFGESNLFKYNHTMSWLMPSMDSLGASGVDPNRLADFNLFVKCQDANGNTNIRPYVINFCVSPEKDITPPMITATIPELGSYLKYSEQKQDIKVYLNEPANCRWSKEDKKYEEMENSFECKTGIEQMQGNGWPCSTTLTNLEAGKNEFYIRCLDQPWLKGTDEESERNPHQESYVYVLMVSESELHIENVLPNGTITAGQEPITLTLTAETSGGVDGTASCKYSFDNEKFANFRDTLSSSHSQTFNMLTRGSYIIYVKCEDSAGNTAESSTSLTLNLDTTPPKIVRVYEDSSRLKIITNEKAECAYTFNDRNFKFENATKMTVAYSTEHSADWQLGKYYIKCKDIWGNEPAGFNIIIQTY